MNKGAYIFIHDDANLPKNADFAHFLERRRSGSEVVDAALVAQAIDEYRKAIRISPGFGAANMQLGLLLASRNQPVEAIKCYEQVIHYEPKSSIARSSLQALLVQTRQFKRAIEEGRKLVEDEPGSFDACFNLGVLLIAQNQFGEAITQLQEAQKLRPVDPRPLQQIRQAEEAQKRLRGR